jgi:hypothetical protein
LKPNPTLTNCNYASFGLVLRQKIAKAIDLLEKAKAVLNGYVPEAEVAIDDALERLDGEGGERE